MIQIGGIGIITIFIYLMTLFSNKFSIKQRIIVQDAINAPNISTVIPLTKFIFTVTFIIETIGAILLMPVFASKFGFLKGIWYSIFHSVSAFCNAGFDLNGNFSSLTGYTSNLIINLVIPLLIVIGGIGFLTWNDVKNHKFRLSKYSMQSKVVLFVTLLLILVPACYLFFFELTNLPLKERIMASIFQSITTRTAGFNTIDLNNFSESGIFLLIILMLIGASPSSTGGGMKITTFALVIASLLAVIFKKNEVQMFNRRVSSGVIMNAISIFFIYITLFVISAMVISKIEGLSMLESLFETASAIATVGLTLGITTSLGIVSKIILILLMFFGRVGGLTIIFATMNKQNKIYSLCPYEDIVVG